MLTLGEISKFLRSKNAGPFVLTLDVILPDKQTFDVVESADLLTPARIADLYGRPAEDVKVIPFPAANAFKAVMLRRRPSGHIGDTDIYGAQQHVPLMTMDVSEIADRLEQA